MNTPDNDENWIAAEKALETARRLPGGRERIEALKHAGRLRFDADRKRREREREPDVGQPGPPSEFTKRTG